ncbi:NYN domain-containing protein [Cobetia crustatorum]|uniref:NYN domain-containing protein n=1 Tax=Cobetia crustatorum TaxID=553385 RepID=UPI0012EC0BE5
MTDVNISLHAYHDAISDEDLDVVVLVTNDTDLVPAAEFIKEYTDKKIVVVTPTRIKEDRKTNSGLAENADIVRHRIDNLELERSQLERVIHGKRKPITKPISWYGNHDVLEKVLDVTDRINGGSRSKSFQWLNSTGIEKLNYQKPIVLIENREHALNIFNMVADYLLELEEKSSLRP